MEAGFSVGGRNPASSVAVENARLPAADFWQRAKRVKPTGSAESRPDHRLRCYFVFGLSRYFCAGLVAGTGSNLRFRTTMASPCSAKPIFRTIDGLGASAGAAEFVSAGEVAGEFVSALAVSIERRAARTSSFFMEIPVDVMRAPYGVGMERL